MSAKTRPAGLLDTNTLILLPQLNAAAALPEVPLISAITLAELSVGPLVATSKPESARRQAHLQQAEADFEPLPFDASAARAFGRVAASLRHRGRKPAARAYDALIAATALANDLPLYTVNPSDFSGIDGLEVVPVPHPTTRPRPWSGEHSRARSRPARGAWIETPTHASAGWHRATAGRPYEAFARMTVRHEPNHNPRRPGPRARPACFSAVPE